MRPTGSLELLRSDVVDVAGGPPQQNCTIAIDEWVEDNFPRWGRNFIILSVSFLIGLIATSYILLSKKDELEYAHFRDE